jgi:hypothetical protein
MTPGVGGRIRWDEVQEEASALVAAATRRGAVLRLVGSTGIRMHCGAAREEMDALARPAKDIDLICRATDRTVVRAVFEESGYRVDQEMLVATEGTRFAFTRPDGIEIDLFVDRLEFCHTLELRDRLGHHERTIPIEDLLLQKLQIVEQMPSDIVDTTVLLATHPLGDDDDPETIDRRYVAGLLARDWGFHHTVAANLERVVSSIEPGDVRDRAAALLDAIDSAPKALSWKMRAKVGERMQWWEEVAVEREHY